ncbi:PEP-CTERM sorting domain-containing protein [Roseimicrobium sp. ORNL1]|nr:PEP-CTERM sorting domain-containing protein [Roseimicrobium sp. ORNL1]
MNGTTAGAGSATPTGSWDLSSFRWNDLPGTGTTALWGNTGLETAVFAAGNDATGSYVVTLGSGGNLNLSALRVNTGSVTLTPASASDALDFGAVNGALHVASGASLRINAAVRGTSGITKTGAGALTVSGANVFTGATTLQGGQVTLDYVSDNTSKLDSNAALTLAGTRLIITPNEAADTVQSVLNTVINAGSSTVTVNKNAAGNNTTLHLNGITRTSGSVLNIVYGGTGAGIAVATTDNTNTNGILGGWATFNGSTWAVNSSNTSDGAIGGLATYTNDTFAAGNNTDITVAGAGPGNAVLTTNSLRFNQLGTKTLGLGTGAKTITSGGILITSQVGAFTTTINGSNLRAASGADLIFHQHNLSADVIVNAIITNQAAGGLVKTGGGVLVLGGVNTFTGGVVVNQGVLSVSTVADGGVTSNLGAGTTLSLGDGSTFGTLLFTGTSGSTNRTVTLGAAGGVVAVASSSGTLVLTGVLDGTGSFTKYGPGTLTLAGANTFTGSTTILGGTLILDLTTANNDKLNAASALTLSSGALSLTPNAAQDITQSVQGATLLSGANTFTVTKNDAGNNATLNLNTITRSGSSTVNFTYAGTGAGVASITTDNTNTNSILGGWATINGTDWAVNSSNAADGRIDALSAASYYTTTTGGNTQGNYANKHVDVTSSQTFGGAITPYTLRFNTAGAFTLTLTGNNNILNGGILVTPNVGNNAVVITGGNLRGAASGELIIQQHNTANTLTISSTINNNTSTKVVKTGLGTAILAGTNSFTGGLVVNQGRVVVNSALSNNAANAIIIRNGATLSYNYDLGNAVIPVNPLTIEAGGVLTNEAAGQYGTLGDFTLSGGTLTSVGGRNANFQSWGLRGTVTVNGDVTSTIHSTNNSTSGVQLGHNTVDTVTFDVADGASFTDLLISASLRDSRNVANDAFRPSSLIKNGSGRLLSSAANTFTGNVTVNAGTLHFTGTNTFAGTVTVNGGVLQLANTTTFANGATINGGALLVTDSGTLQNVSTNVFTVNNGGSLIFGKSNVFGNYAAVANAPIVVNAGGTVTNQGAFFNILGPLTLNGGTLNSVGGSGTSLPSWALKGNVTVNGGAVTSTISGSGTNAGVALGEAEVTEVIFDVADGAAATDLLISAALWNGRNTANTEFQASSLIKSGAGLLTLSAVNTYTGTTHVQSGTLALASTGSIASSALIKIDSGAVLNVSAHASGYTLGASQTLQAGRTTAPGTDVLGSLVNNGTLNPGGDSSPATLTIDGNLTLQDGGTIRFDFGAAGTVGSGVNDLITLTGILNASGITTILAPSSVPVSGVTYRLFSAASFGAGLSAANFAFGSSGTRQTYTFDTTTTPGAVLLTATGSAADLVWKGNVNPHWDVNTTANWTGAPDQKFFNLDNVTFNDTSTVGDVLVDGYVQPLSVTVNNSTTAYSFTGTGSIAGTTGILKTGTGTLTIGLQNTFSGIVDIREGVLSADTVSHAGTASALGAGSKIVLGGATTTGTLRYTSPAGAIMNKSIQLEAGGGRIEVVEASSSLAVSGAVSGSGNLQKTGAGILFFSGLNDYTGTLTISEGIFRAGSVSALGDTAGGTVIQNGATLDVFGFNLGSEQIQVSGSGVNGAGAIVNNGGAQQLNALRYVTLTGDATFGFGAFRWDIRGDGTAGTSTLDLAGHTLTKIGSGYVGIVNAAVSEGNIAINEGTLAFLQGTSATGNGTITIANGATMSVGNYNVAINITRAIVSKGGTIAAEGVASQSPMLASPITLESGTTTFTSANPAFTLNGGISGAGNLVLSTTNSGTVTLVTKAGDVLGGTLSTGSGTTINIAGTGTVGSFTVQGATSLTGGTIRFDLTNNASAGNDQLLLGNSLSLTGVTTIQVAALNSSLLTSSGSYTLISGITSLTGDASNLALSGIVANTRQTFALDTTSTPGSVLLKVTGSIGSLVWSGPGTWDVNSSQNWNAGAEKFYNWDAVTFNDTSAFGTVAINSIVTPSSVTFNNSNTAYVLSGSGNIAGAGRLVKDGTGLLTLSTANTYTGGTLIRAGEVRVTTATALGTGAVVLGDEFTGSNSIALYLDTNRIQFARAITVSSQGTGTVTLGSRSTVTGTGDNNNFTSITLQRSVIFDSNAAARTDYRNITGTGDIRVTGTGRTILGGTNTFVGNVTVATNGAGYLQTGTGETTGTNYIPDASDVTVEAGARYTLGSVAESIDGLNGAGTVNVTGINGTLTVGAGNGSGDFSGTLADAGANTLALAKSGTGTQILSGMNTYTGGTTVNQGTLLANNVGGSATGTGHVVVRGSGKLGGTGTVGYTGGVLTSNITIGDGTNAATLFVGNASGDTTGKVLTLGTGSEDSTGVITLADGSAFEFDVFGAGDSDRLALFSNEEVVLNGSLHIVNSTGDANFFLNATFGTWQLFDWSGVLTETNYLGGFSNLNGAAQGNGLTDLPQLGSGYAWDWSGLYTTGQISIVTAAVVPEPSRALLLLGGISMLLLRRRRGAGFKKQ